MTNTRQNPLPTAFREYCEAKIERLKLRIANLETGKLTTAEQVVNSSKMESTTVREAQEARAEIEALENMLRE